MMTNRYSNRAAIVVAAISLTATAVIFGGTPPGHSHRIPANENSQRQAAGVMPIQSRLHGLSYAEWSAKWWQWLYSFQALPPTGAPYPNYTDGAVDCSAGQITSNHAGLDHVWFLAGTYGGTANRSCNVPVGTSLFIPVLNIAADNVGTFDPPPGTAPTNLSVKELTDLVKGAMDNPIELHASIDGVPVFVKNYRATSGPFDYVLPATHNIYDFWGYTVPGLNWPSLVVRPAVSDGYWLMVNPLSKGRHVINFGGTTSYGFVVDITYHINVVAPK